MKKQETSIQETTYEDLQQIIRQNPILKELPVPDNIILSYNLDKGTKLSWEELAEELPKEKYKEILNNFLAILHKRNEVEWDLTGLPNKYLKYAVKSVEETQDSRFNQSLFVGRGNSGIVYAQEGNENLCIKYIHTQPKDGNTIFQEFELLDYIKGINFKMIRVPGESFLTPNAINPEKSLLVMKRVQGLSVANIGTHPDKYFNLINGDYEKLEGIIKKLEENFKIYLDDISILHKNNIIHADLHSGNVLLDKDGEIYLIDFGKSINIQKYHLKFGDEKISDSMDNLIEREKRVDLINMKQNLTHLIFVLKELLKNQNLTK